jgi:uncharacterized protein YbbC (DUF1343 family)
MSLETGLDVSLAEGLSKLTGKRAGLITNHSAVDRRFRNAVDLLHESDVVELVALFGPEHGVRGDAQAGVHVDAAVDARTGLPVYSLYGEAQRPTAEMLAGLDALIFDIQDVGVRYATYISTMVYAMEAASAAGLAFVVLDRPNPLNGVQLEGNLLDPGFASFVGVHSIPIRHGMTAGELALLIAAEHGMAEPGVVEMRGWRRGQWFDETGLPWVQPSPNLPTLDTVTLYPGTCLIEGTNVSEGRGTTRPFEYIGAPWIDPFQLAGEMESRQLSGCAFRPAYFTPTFSKHAGQVCGGVQVHIIDRDALRAVDVGLHLLEVLLALYPSEIAWREAGEGSFFIDRLLGSDRPRQLLSDGVGAAEVMESWGAEREAFAERRGAFLLYG